MGKRAFARNAVWHALACHTRTFRAQTYTWIARQASVKATNVCKKKIANGRQTRLFRSKMVGCNVGNKDDKGVTNMTKRQPTERVYLAIGEELAARIDVAYAAAKRGKQNYARTQFLEYLVRYALDNKDGIKGARAALAYGVGDRLTEKIDTVTVILLAIFYLIAARSNAPDALKNEAFLWATENSTKMQQRVAELRHGVAKQNAASETEQA